MCFFLKPNQVVFFKKQTLTKKTKRKTFLQNHAHKMYIALNDMQKA